MTFLADLSWSPTITLQVHGMHYPQHCQEYLAIALDHWHCLSSIVTAKKFGDKALKINFPSNASTKSASCDVGQSKDREISILRMHQNFTNWHSGNVLGAGNCQTSNAPLHCGEEFQQSQHVFVDPVHSVFGADQWMGLGPGPPVVPVRACMKISHHWQAPLLQREPVNC